MLGVHGEQMYLKLAKVVYRQIFNPGGYSGDMHKKCQACIKRKVLCELMSAPFFEVFGITGGKASNMLFKVH